MRISKDGKEMKILGKWYTEKELTIAIQLLDKAKALITEESIEDKETYE